MTYDYTARCPRCASADVYAFEPTITGQSYYCPKCSERWRVTVEDKTLDLIGASLAARRHATRQK
jgi:transposase-like protein